MIIISLEQVNQIKTKKEIEKQQIMYPRKCGQCFCGNEIIIIKMAGNINNFDLFVREPVILSTNAKH